MSKSLPRVTPDAAFFIDFDGTLAEIAERPDLVEVEPRAAALLQALQAKTGDAVAILTGRPLAVIDQMLAPMRLPVGAEHGSVRRDAAGVVHRDFEGAESLKAAVAHLQPLAAQYDRLVLEHKESSAALHYRRQPELADICLQAVEAALEGARDLHLLKGKMVLEIKAEGLDKGRALQAFMEEAPFAGRVPVMIGDDTTDEFGFAAANALGGISVKIGEEDTQAHYRTDREGFFRWLEAFAGLGAEA